MLAWSSDDRGIKRIKEKVDSERQRDIDIYNIYKEIVVVRIQGKDRRVLCM